MHTYNWYYIGYVIDVCIGSRQFSCCCYSGKMEARLAVSTKKEQGRMIRFLCPEHVTWTKIHRRLLTQYGNCALQRRSAYEGFENLKSGWQAWHTKEEAVRPSASTTVEKIQQDLSFFFITLKIKCLFSQVESVSVLLNGTKYFDIDYWLLLLSLVG